VSRRSGLGRGLGSLIPSASPEAAGGSELKQLPIDRVRPNPLQPRKHFDEEALASLVDSIKAVGILQPVLVRLMPTGDYELIAGERRFRAAHRAGLATLPALVRGADDAASLEQALVENLHREDLNALDEAGAYQQLIEDFGLTHDEVARRVGKSRTAVTNALRLFQLPPAVQRHMRDGLLTAGHGRALLGTPDRARQEELAREAVRRGLSVRMLEEMVRASLLADDPSLAREATAPDIGPSAVNGQQPVPPDQGRPAGMSSPRGDAHASTPRSVGRGEPSPTEEEQEDHPSEGPRQGRLRPPGVLDLEELLGDHLNTRVTVDVGGKRGRVVIEFANLDDLERIYRLMIGEK
jgi:ParB family chromosome partitioning protein